MLGVGSAATGLGHLSTRLDKQSNQHRFGRSFAKQLRPANHSYHLGKLLQPLEPSNLKPEADRLSAFTAPWRSLVGAGRVETLKAFDGFRLFVAARVCAVLYQRVIFHC